MMKRVKIGVALSGGGSRAIAFHLGCLRALHDLDLLDQIEVVSTVSGGSVIGGLFATNYENFQKFEARVREHLSKGFVWPSIIKALTTTEGLKALACWVFLLPTNFLLTIVIWCAGAVARFLPPERRKGWGLEKFHSPILRFASRTTILRRVFNDDVFNRICLNDIPAEAPLLIINAAELRTGSAFYFSQRSSGTWRIGELVDRNILLAHAVSASAAYPLFLPALDEVLTFTAKDGTRRKERVSLTDGGAYDNLGLAPLWPDRDSNISFNVTKVDFIICCRAGYGLRFDAPSQFLLGRITSVFFCLFDRTQNSATSRLFDLGKAGKLKGAIMPYLGQDDSRLTHPPDDLVTQKDIYAYPTDFSAMSEEWINKLSKRGEQLTKALIKEHLTHLMTSN